MVAPFYAGFLSAWTIVYAVAAGYCVWGSRRARSDPGIGVLGIFFAVLACASVTDAASMLTHGALEDALCRISHAATMVAPILVVHFTRSEEGPAGRMRFLVVGYAASAMLAVAALTGAFDFPNDGGAFQLPSAVGQAASVVFTLGVISAAYFLGRAISRSKSFGLFSFIGSCFLAVFAVYDCVAAFITHPRPALGLLGFTLFTLFLFLDQIVRLARRRELLLQKTLELSKKSKSLSKSHKELRARQDELVRKEQLAAIGELSAVIAHEVRNPLAIMSNAVATLRRSNVDAEARETLLGILSEEGARLNQLVGDLLHYAKPLAVQRQSINLFELITKAVKTVEDKPNVLLRVSHAERVPRVGGDPLLLRQAFDNLVNNAVQAMANGGTLTVEIDAAKGEELGAELIIRDTGEGMDTVVRSRALDPFFTTRPSGTGLGLAIVARVIDAHGGTLTIRSERGAGTEVRVYLPADHEDIAPRVGPRLVSPIIEPFEITEDPKKEAS